MQLSGTNSMADAWRMLQPQQGPCTSVPTLYKVLPKALALHYLLYSTSTAINSFTNMPSKYKSIAYLYTRHGGSAELAPPMAIED